MGWGKGYRVTCFSSTGNMNDLTCLTTMTTYVRMRRPGGGGGTPLCMHDIMYSILSVLLSDS